MTWEPREPGTQPIKTKQTVINGASWTLEKSENVKTIRQLRKENRVPNPGETPKGFIFNMKPLRNLQSDKGLLKMWDDVRKKQREQDVQELTQLAKYSGP